MLINKKQATGYKLSDRSKTIHIIIRNKRAYNTSNGVKCYVVYTRKFYCPWLRNEIWFWCKKYMYMYVEPPYSQTRICTYASRMMPHESTSYRSIFAARARPQQQTRRQMATTTAAVDRRDGHSTVFDAYCIPHADHVITCLLSSNSVNAVTPFTLIHISAQCERHFSFDELVIAADPLGIRVQSHA